MAILRKIFWLAIFLLSTLSFVVLFEHGPNNFQQNLAKEITEFRGFVDRQIHPPKEETQ